MVFYKINGIVYRGDGKSTEDIIVIVSQDGVSGVIPNKEVPKLTEEDLVLAYNSMIDGKIVFVASENDELFIVKQANSVDDNATIYFDFEETHILKYTLTNDEVEITAKEIGSGSGAVESVNGKVGVVVLNASDILAQNAQTVQQNLERIDELIDDANADIETLQEDLEDVRDIAQNKTNSYVVSLLSDITGTQDADGNFTNVTAITGIDDLSVLKIGDNVFVIDKTKPDFWVSQITPNIKLNVLQTEKIDIENYYTKDETYSADEVDELLENKQDTISDLETIRSGAGAGATAVQPSELNNYATKNELGDKQNKETTETDTTTTVSRALSSNKVYAYTQPLTSLNIVALETQTGDLAPSWKVKIKIGSGFTFTSQASLVWKNGTPNFSDYVGEEHEILFEPSLTANTFNAWLI